MKYTVTIRGRLKEAPAAAKRYHDDVTTATKDAAKQAGDLTHAVYLDPQDPKAFFGVDTWIGARRVDERKDRTAKLLAQLHHAQSLAITLGLGHAVVAAYALLGVATFLMTDEHHRPVLEPRRTADDGEVIAIHAIAVQLVEVIEDEAGVIERVRTLRMTRQLRDLPGRKIREDVLRELLALLLQARDLFLDVDRGARRNMFQFFDFGFEFGDRLLEIEEIHCHRIARIPYPLIEDTPALTGGGLYSTASRPRPNNVSSSSISAGDGLTFQSLPKEYVPRLPAP